MKVLVVGASGFIGQRVVERLRQGGHIITAVARSRSDGIDCTVDVTIASKAELRELLAGHDGAVFAAGVDPRSVPRRPAYPVFHRGNVAPVVKLLGAARATGATRAIVLGSYFTHFARQHPEWDLAVTHPYIRSRIEQTRAAREAAGPNLPVTVLELPFVFGRTGDRLPNWSPPVAKWVRSRLPLFAPVGGSAVTTVSRVADTAVEALEQALDTNIPVVDENLTWADFIERAADAAGHPRRVRALPSGVVRAALKLIGAIQAITGKQSGLNPAQLANLVLTELFVEPISPRSVNQAIKETFAT